MLTSVPEQDASYLDQPQIVGSLLLIAHQDRPALREPTQCSLHDPPPRRVPLLARLVELLLADASDVGHVASSFHELLTRPVVIALVQAKMRGRLLGRLRPLDRHSVEGRSEELVVAHVRSGYHHRKRTALGLDQKGAFHPILAPVGGVGAYEVPPKR